MEEEKIIGDSEERLCSIHCTFFKACEDSNTLSQPGAPCTRFSDGTTAYEVALEARKDLPPAVQAYIAEKERERGSPPEEYGG